MARADELALLKLSHSELRVYLALNHLENRWGDVVASVEDLAELTGYGRSSISKAISGLSTHGFIEITRTKRNYGLLSKNRYRILDCPENWTSEPEKPENDAWGSPEYWTSTRNTNKLITTNKLLTTSKLKYLNPADLNSAEAQKEETVVNRWSEDDDNIAGVGLFEDEVKPVEKKIPKNDPKTRGLRPQAEWTPADVASEFAARLYSKIRGIPGLVNTRALWGALARNRKQFGVTAAQEMAALERFLGDERNLLAIKRNAKGAHGMFLNAITRQLAENAAITPEVVDKPKVAEYVYASDGKEFDNSMYGRNRLRIYEESLKG